MEAGVQRGRLVGGERPAGRSGKRLNRARGPQPAGLILILIVTLTPTLTLRQRFDGDA
jgi:hypothetical protein